MLANVVYRLVYGDFLRLLPFRLMSFGPSRLAIRRRSSHVAESGVGVLHLVIFRLSLCRRDPGSLHRNAPPGVVWSGDSPDYLGNICILLVRILCGHHQLKSRGPSTVSFRSRLWTVRCIHSVVVSCRPFFTPSRTSSCVWPTRIFFVLVLPFIQSGWADGFRISPRGLKTVWTRDLCCLSGVDVRSLCQRPLGPLQVWLRPLIRIS